MITKITGTPVAVAADMLTLAVGAFEYEMLIPEFARRQLQEQIGREVSLHTIEYLEGNPMQGRLIPRLVGFLNPIEREFFEMFCEVDGVGVKKALRAMVRPVQEVAAMIEEQDAKGLATLPGIGPATAERIIAKLRRRVPKFALLVAGEPLQRPAPKSSATSQRSLRSAPRPRPQRNRRPPPARRRPRQEDKYKDVDSLLHAVYEKTHGE